ncbi:MAG: galactokinase [Herpetosiphon sp.]
MIDTDRIVSIFADHYGTSAAFVGRAPGRVNLIGEHTDYNQGWVLPVAVDRDVAIAATPRTDRTLRIFAAAMREEHSFDLDNLSRGEFHWSAYAAGMASMLESSGHRLSGADLALEGDVPMATGLSSSAALEVAIGITVAMLSGAAIDRVELARLAQRTENEWIGLNTGIMDQLISALGRANHALLIDCRDYSSVAIPIPPDVRIIVCNSKKSRELAHSAYNVRRQECEQAVSILSTALPAIGSLRDISLVDLVAHKAILPPIVYQRAYHVVSENARVHDGAAALRAGDLAGFGQLMNASHQSLRDDYAVSSLELNTLVEAAQRVPGTYGSRLTGAGFGGCTVSLVAPTAVESFKHVVTAAYRTEVGYDPDIYVCTASNGASVVPV